MSKPDWKKISEGEQRLARLVKKEAERMALPGYEVRVVLYPAQTKEGRECREEYYKEWLKKT